MKLCNETVTIFNKRVDSTTGAYMYYPTVISGVSWFCEIASVVDGTGIHAANRYTIRIPIDANFRNAKYVDAIAYREADDVDGLFTLAQGDVIVRAAVELNMSLAQLQSNYAECCTILGVTDNRRAPNAPHFKVVGS